MSADQHSHEITKSRKKSYLVSCFRVFVALSVAVFAIGLVEYTVTAQQPQAARTAKAAAVFDPTGYWVPLITEDWRFRMVTPPKGDVSSVPLSAEGRRVADTAASCASPGASTSPGTTTTR